MKDEQVSGAPQILELAGKEFECFPLSDRDLDGLTQWIRYRINKDAREQAEFAETPREAAEIKEEALQYSLLMEWYQKAAINRILRDPAGLTHVVWLMIKRKFKKEWFEHKFGEGSNISDEHLENREKVSQLFLEQNIVSNDSETEEEEPSGKK